MMKLKEFNWKLFCSLCLLALIPLLVQTIQTFILSNNVSTDDINIIGQIEWYDLIDETIIAFLIVPLYAILNKIYKDYSDSFSTYVYKTLIICFLFYLLFSLIVLMYSENLIKFMNPNINDISKIRTYLYLETIAFIIGIIPSFINVVFIVIGKAKYIYIMLITKTLIVILSNLLIIPFIGINGVALSNIIMNVGLSTVALIVLVKNKNIKFSFFKKEDFSLFKKWIKIGFFSSLQQLIDNLIYALMICKMVNMVAEQGNYWIANNFIWGWILIPISALSEVIKKDCQNGYNNLLQSNYYVITILTILFSLLSFPLWLLYFKNIEQLVNYKTIYFITICLAPFYIFYAFQRIPFSIFIGLGKTNYNFINSLLVNLVYYLVWFIMYKSNIVQFTMNIIIIMFGCGMIVSMIISFIEEKIIFKKYLMQVASN